MRNQNIADRLMLALFLTLLSSCKTVEYAPESRTNQSKILTAFLALAETNFTPADITLEEAASALGKTIEPSMGDSTGYGFGGELTKDWNYGVGLEKDSIIGPRFELSFTAKTPGAYMPMSDICQMDFDDFASKLERIGFQHSRHYGQHGALGWDSFTDIRPQSQGLIVDVYTRAEASYQPPHDCIKNIVAFDESPPDAQTAAKKFFDRLSITIEKSRSITDLDQDTVSDLSGTETINYGPMHYGATGSLSENWMYAIEVDQNSGNYAPRFDLRLTNKAKDSKTALTEICHLDFETFSARLVVAGFVKRPYYGMHGGISWVRYNRSGMSVEVYPQGESVTAPDHLCIESVIIQSIAPEATDITEKRLLGLLQLIESSRSINDFTEERVSQFMNANLSHDDKGSYGFSDRPSDRWIAGYGVQVNSRGQPQFEAYFQEVPLSSHPPMTDICRLDFAEFARRLEEIGFVRHTASYLHGERGWDWFDSAEKRMVIEVYAHGEASYPTELISHECIYNVIIK